MLNRSFQGYTFFYQRMCSVSWSMNLQVFVASPSSLSRIWVINCWLLVYFKAYILFQVLFRNILLIELHISVLDYRCFHNPWELFSIVQEYRPMTQSALGLMYRITLQYWYIKIRSLASPVPHFTRITISVGKKLMKGKDPTDCHIRNFILLFCLSLNSTLAKSVR